MLQDKMQLKHQQYSFSNKKYLQPFFYHPYIKWASKEETLRRFGND